MPRLRGAALALLGCLACAAEPDGSGASLDELRGKLLGAPPLLVLPEGPWRAQQGALRPPAADRLALSIRSGRSWRSPLVVVVSPAAGLAQPVARWDDREALAVRERDGGLEIRVAARALEAGEHRLELRWSGAPSAPPRLRAIRGRAGQRGGRLSAGNVNRWRRLAEFLELGVAGPADVRLGGIAALGDHTIAVRVEGARAGRFRATPWNDSGTPSRLAVRGPAGAELWRAVLAPGQRTGVDLELPAGLEQLELVGTGAGRHGVTLWGEPRLVAAPGRRPPLLLLLTLDTTRRDALGAFGAPAAATPHLDRLARDSTLYLAAASTGSWTLPSHASLFTGAWPRRHGAGVTASALGPALPTLAGELARRYRTVGLGGGPWLGERSGLARGFGYYEPPLRWERSGRELTDRALALLAETGDEPLLLFVNYFDPHFPFAAAGDSTSARAARTAAALMAGDDPARAALAGDHLAWRAVLHGRTAVGERARAAFRAAYAADVAEMDAQVGRLLDHLRATGRYDSALIVAVADHGELLGEDGRWSHGGSLAAELTAVPLIVKYPGQRAERRDQQLVSVVDLFATVLAIAGAPVPDHDGIPLLDAEALGRRSEVAFEEHSIPLHRFFPGYGPGPHLIGRERRGERIVRWRGGAECAVRADSSWRPVDCDRQELAALGRESARLPLEPPAPSQRVRELSAEEQAGLRALGYL